MNVKKAKARLFLVNSLSLIVKFKTKYWKLSFRSIQINGKAKKRRSFDKISMKK